MPQHRIRRSADATRGFLFASRVILPMWHALPLSKILSLPLQVSPGTKDKEPGGVLIVRPELGEPTHKIATRGVGLWKEFDCTVFIMPTDKRPAWLAERRAEIIGKLNKGSRKP